MLIVDETGDPKRGHRIVLAAQQYLGKLGPVAHGVVAVTSHWADGSRHMPLGVKPYRPASRLPKGRKDPDFHTKPQLAWQLIEEARAAGIPFRLVVADSIYGENADLEAKLYGAKIPYIMGLKPSHGTWQQVDDRANPPAFTPAEAAARLPLAAWERTVRFDSHGQELVRSIAELELGTTYGPDTGIRLVAATLDPTQLKPESTWYLATSLPLALVSAEQVYELYRLRDWIEHSWCCWPLPSASWSVRCRPLLPRGRMGEKSEPTSSQPASGTASVGRVVWNAALRRVRAWLCPWARLQLYWRRWSSTAPPPELAALLAHVASARPLEAPT